MLGQQLFLPSQGRSPAGRPSSLVVIKGVQRRAAPCNAANIGHSPSVTGLLSGHPDAIRRREQAEARRAAAKKDAQSAQSSEWWRVPSNVLPSNLVTAASPDAFREAIGGDRLVVVDFFAPWCMACRRLFPALLRLAENNPDILFVKVNGGDTMLSSFVESLAVDKLPYFHFYRGGSLVSHFAANLSKVSMLRAEIAALKDSVLSNLFETASFLNSNTQREEPFP